MLQQYKHILVPVDGSYEAELAFKKAVAVAKRNDADLHLVHVFDTRAFQIHNFPSLETSMVEQVTETAEKTLDKYVADAKADGLDKIDYAIEYGAPKIIIGDVPRGNDTDLIMIGATGLNAVGRLLIGSVTEYVTRTAVCDVIVVRTDLDNQPAKAAHRAE
ncbi:universal stress protein UspA (plasmid) [Secundilactobacillus paracollinoides]|uniref:Universal stress protein n=1 Tax=Secundilactobacillus paracollinoides TaxID=240427 RepID=A0A1B2J2Y4_9LACO|nr:universal stress protein [Secundilactobacillus paracollinoides]ANZ65594.1 universal stress protein UspA [Secundilactobacillus paracollinoides]ANZ68609.1 universal stress protein UspA [Secundilactobacillus paracollinoides]